MNRICSFKQWFYIIQTNLPKGNSTVLATVCTRYSAEQYITSLQNVKHNQHKSLKTVYSIAPTVAPISLQKCDICKRSNP